MPAPRLHGVITVAITGSFPTKRDNPCRMGLEDNVRLDRETLARRMLRSSGASPTIARSITLPGDSHRGAQLAGFAVLRAVVMLAGRLAP
jgi:hypothetical protein